MLASPAGFEEAEKPTNEQDSATNEEVTDSPDPPSSDAKSALIEPRSFPLNDSDPVEQALAEAITLAAKAAHWSTVETLSRELSARRLARTAPDVATLEAHKKRKKDAP